MVKQVTITELPSDILYMIFPYLDAAEFLRFTSSSRSLLAYREEATPFWHALTRKTFRIPPQPLLQGKRWQWLYKKLLTQTQLYTWGDNKSGNLGHRIQNAERLESSRARHGVPSDGFSTRRRSGWPRQPYMDMDIGIVADVQCGGWSTTLLTSVGAVYMYGYFDGLSFGGANSSRLRQLCFPLAYPQTMKDRYEPSTAIAQLSTGRSSVLGLSDDGKVWSWTQDRAVLIKSVHVDLMANKVTKVVTGWNRSSMYVKDVGIVYWSADSDSQLVEGGRQQALSVADALLIDTVTIPGTAYERNHRTREIEGSLAERIGHVTNHIVLEAHIVFTTDLNKIFGYETTFPMPALDMPKPVELTTFYDVSSPPFQIRDLQGSFANFAVFTTSGAILTASRSLLDAFHARSKSPPATNDAALEPLPKPQLPSSLQSPTIISLAFGDHHYHALHANGTITSYGTECQRCGALGLGDGTLSNYRGVLANRGNFGDARLPPDLGRTVWFEPLMEKWLGDMQAKTVSGEGRRVGNMIRGSHVGACKASGDFFEREGAKWEDGVAGTTEGEERGDDDGMGAYFVLKVASAGWSSAALVLVDEEKAERARRKHVIPPTPPPPTGDEESAAAMETSQTSNNSADSWDHEFIAAPWEQLSGAVFGVKDWIWKQGRRFLGLAERDRRVEREEGKEEGAEGRMRYTWDEEPFPLLRFEGDGVVGGDVAAG